MQIWYRVIAVEGCGDESVALAALAGSGLEPTPFQGAVPRGPGIVFFDRISPPLYEMLREASASGFGRVLAVALAREALTCRGSWALLQAGASDVIAMGGPCPIGPQIAARIERWQIVDRLLCSPLVAHNLVGTSRAWTRALRHLVEMARFTEAPVLLLGESGTGKELAARLVHALDLRPTKGDMVVVDCTTIVPELSGSEFFGHERGAFTGAAGQRDGAFALANGGTLFLDEVGELPLPMQAQLLRVVQERTYKRVGGNNWQDTQFRLVCATNRDLPQEVERGTFRRDLYYRIASTVCQLPRLADRAGDVLLLARYFIKALGPEVEPPPFDDEVCEYLAQRVYPGNVRDLRQLVTRIFYRHAGTGSITVGDIPEDERPQDAGPQDWRDGAFEETIRRAIVLGVGLKDIGRAAEDIAVRLAVDDAEGNLQTAASRLGVTDRALQLRRAARKQPD